MPHLNIFFFEIITGIFFSLYLSSVGCHFTTNDSGAGRPSANICTNLDTLADVTKKKKTASRLRDRIIFDDPIVQTNTHCRHIANLNKYRPAINTHEQRKKNALN